RSHREGAKTRSVFWLESPRAPEMAPTKMIFATSRLRGEILLFFPRGVSRRHPVEEDEGAGGEALRVGEGGDGEVALDGALRVQPDAGVGEIGEREAAPVERNAQGVLLALRQALRGRGRHWNESGAQIGCELLPQLRTAGA